MKEQSRQTPLAGVFRRGYGIASKAVLHDPDLTLESKAIYAYLCALAGGDGVTYPYRDTILRDLGLSKNTYYRHYRPLVDRGILEVRRPEDKSAANIYILWRDKPAAYGRIPRAVMVDQSLSIKAKGLYAYLCAYAGTAGRAFPQKRDMLFHLGISEPTCRKACGQLRDAGYLAAAQRRESGRFAVNDYVLVGFGPSPSGENGDTKKRDKENRDAKNRTASLKTNASNTSSSSTSPSNGRRETTDPQRIWDQLRQRCWSSPPEQRARLEQSTRVLERMLAGETRRPDAAGWLRGQLDRSDAPQRLWEALEAFDTQFRDKLRGRVVRNLPAYWEASLCNWLAEQPLRRAGPGAATPGRGGSPPASYDLAEVARFIESGVGL